MQNYNFESSFQKIIRLEGGFTLHKNATESTRTYAGIYRKEHPDWDGWHYIDQNEQPPTDAVRRFYQENYWNQIKIKDGSTKYLLFEFSVNAGFSKAIKLAQTVLKLVPDGIFGPITQKALSDVGQDFVFIYTLARIKYYTDLANRNPKKYAIYLRGWINRALEAVS